MPTDSVAMGVRLCGLVLLVLAALVACGTGGEVATISRAVKNVPPPVCVLSHDPYNALTGPVTSTDPCWAELDALRVQVVKAELREKREAAAAAERAAEAAAERAAEQAAEERAAAEAAEEHSLAPAPADPGENPNEVDPDYGGGKSSGELQYEWGCEQGYIPEEKC